MALRIGITQKLSLIFFLFFLIFSGTVFVLLGNVQKMVETTEKIVSKNKKIDELTAVLQINLLDMDGSHKKFLLLKRKRYAEYFEKAKSTFETTLQQALALATLSPGRSTPLQQLAENYHRQWIDQNNGGDSLEIASHWVNEQVFNSWLDTLSEAKRLNHEEIQTALQDLNENSKISERNGLYGFCVSILVGCIGIWFISRSIFTPLKTLAKGLKNIAIEKQQQPIHLRGGNEFNELATAFNDMSRQLFEEENIRTEFIATLSHEIRTPLSSINESVQMIAEEVFGPINEKQRKFLEIASVEIKRIIKLMNHLLNVGVLEADIRAKNSILLDTKELVTTCADLFVAPAERKKISLRLDNFHDCPPIFGVKEEVQQVFVNILGNAIKYSPERGRVFISWYKDPNSRFLLLHVADTGPGIADDEKSLIFTKYYRTKSARGHLDGVGLGLAISRRIVAGYGGQIVVNNNEESGCTFSFSLPTRP